ncbi:Proteasome subunit beta type-3 [Orobanche gracilis]
MASPRHPPRSSSHSPHTPHSPASHTQTTSTSRNPTRCRSMSKRRIDGNKLPLDIDLVTGKIKYEHKIKLSTYLGKLAKDHVSILYDRLNYVPDMPDKEMLWQDVLANFDVSQISNIAQFRKKTLQSIGTMWRQFKTDLTGEYIYGPSKGLSPCEKYGISEDDWNEFKKIRDDPTWEEKRIKKQEIAKMNNAPHTMARGGYYFVEVREMERKMKERKEEASKSGEDVIIDPPSPPSRHQRWKLGRQKRSGGVSSDAAQEIVTKIDELEEQYTQGSFNSEGRRDILAEAIGRPKHLGRVRGIGFGVGIRDYFGRSSRRSSSLINANVLEELTKKITYDVTQNLMKTFGQTLESLGAHSHQPHVDQSTPDDHVTCVSTKGSCTDVVSGPFGGKTPAADTGRFGFYVDEHSLHLVAIGRVHDGDSTLHCAPLPAHLIKVVVEEVVDGSAEVPIPTEEVRLVREALGTFILWPKNLVIADFIKAIERPKKQARQDDWPRHRDDTIIELFSVAATLFSDPLPVPWDTASFGCGSSDVPLYISYNDLLKIIQGIYRN